MKNKLFTGCGCLPGYVCEPCRKEIRRIILNHRICRVLIVVGTVCVCVATIWWFYGKAKP